MTVLSRFDPIKDAIFLTARTPLEKLVVTRTTSVVFTGRTRNLAIWLVLVVGVLSVPLVASGRVRSVFLGIVRKLPYDAAVERRVRPPTMAVGRWLGLLPEIRKPIYADSTLGPGRYAINLGVNADWSTDGAWVDARKSLRRWGRPDRPWLEKRNLKLSADGYPLSDAGTLSYLRGYPDGRYHLSYEGTGEVKIGGMGVLVGPMETHSGVRSGVVSIDHTTHDLFTLTVTGIDLNDPIRNLRLIRPGFPPDTRQIYARPFLRRLQPFSIVRVMDWTCVNRKDVREWADRVQPEGFLRTGSEGVSYEDIIALANESGKDLWLTIPDGANDPYVNSLAKLLHQGLNPQRRIDLELGNELWNGSFPQARRLAIAAREDLELTRSDDFGRAGERAAKRLAEIADLFRIEFGKESSRIVPILCGQSANPYFLSSGLEYLSHRKGGVRGAIGAVAIAPYLALPHSMDKAGLAQETLFEGLEQFLRENLCKWIDRHAELAGKYELPLIAYEGGQHLTPFNPTDRVDVNEVVKQAAQDDPRMGDLYVRLNQEWTQRGGGLFSFYSLSSSYGKGGYWGLLAHQTSAGSVKWDAVLTSALPPGDATLDGRVDMADFRVLAGHFGQREVWREQGDLNRDRTVNQEDLTIFRAKAAGLSRQEEVEIDEFISKHANP